jgi:hypothetical protein
MQDIEKLSDAAAVKALSEVVKEWSRRRGVEALILLTKARQAAPAAFEAGPGWAVGPPESTSEAGQYARKMLDALATGNDDEVIDWTKAAVGRQLEAMAHVLDPISLSIIGHCCPVN